MALLLGSIFGGLLVGIPVAVVATGALVGVLYSKFTRLRSGTVVRFSEYGVELSDQLTFRVRLAWPDITRLGQVDTRMAGSDKIGEDGGVKVGVGSMKSLGLVGWGERVTPPTTPDWLRGAMGQWVRMYRPDLLGAQPPAGPYQPGPPQPGGYPPPLH